jgi:uncharacterized protein YndB with AHSA1/START domain
MRIAIIAAEVILGALLLFVGIAAVIGMALPHGHVAARTVTVKQTPEQVFAIISDVEKMPTWRTDITRVEILPFEHGRAMFREHGSDVVTYSVEASEPPRRRVVRIADANLPYAGTWTYDVMPAGSAAAPITQITITERGEVRNPLFRFIARFMFSHHATIDAYLVALGRKLGESVTPEDAAPR